MRRDSPRVAAVETHATASAAVPAGLRAFPIPANTYAVFTWQGHISEFPAFVSTVWSRHLPAAHLDPIAAPDSSFTISVSIA